jgi:hypothetical protein
MLNFTAWMIGIEGYLLNFVAGNSGLFLGIAQSAVTGFAIVLLCMYGMKALQAVESGEGMRLMGLFTLFLKLGLVLFVIIYWVIPAPGLGVPIGTYIPNKGLYFAQLIGWNGAQTAATNMMSYAGMEVPVFLSGAWLWWLIAQIFLFLDSVFLFLVLIGPLMFEAVLVCVGPIFVVMWPIPELTGIARGYFRCLITYSIVPIIAAELLNITAQILLPSLNGLESAAIPIEQALPRLVGLCVMYALSVVAMVYVTKLASHVASGSAGAGNEWLAAGVAALGAKL